MTNLTTFYGWTAAAQKLLKGKPNWSAILDNVGQTYFVKVDDEVCACAVENDADYAYTEDNLVQLDISAWNGDAWDGYSVEQCQRIITDPQFVTLKHS